MSKLLLMLGPNINNFKCWVSDIFAPIAVTRDYEILARHPWRRPRPTGLGAARDQQDCEFCAKVTDLELRRLFDLA